jgi:splicing factor 3B subunit 4
MKKFKIMVQLLYDTFSNFGTLITSPKIIKSYTKNGIKYYALLTYNTFEAADCAIYSMDKQFFNGNIINVCYSYKNRSSSSYLF